MASNQTREMGNLNEDVMLKVLSYMNLNERVNIRLVSKRFKELTDYIKIKKLIIFEKIKPIPGQLTGIEEPYSLLDTVEVHDLAKFLNNPIILEQLKSVEKLVIHGYRPKPLECNVSFDQLTYLELNNVLFNKLQTSKIAYHLVSIFGKSSSGIESIVISKELSPLSSSGIESIVTLNALSSSLPGALFL